MKNKGKYHLYFDGTDDYIEILNSYAITYYLWGVFHVCMQELRP